MLSSSRVRLGKRYSPSSLRRTLAITLLVKLIMLTLLWVILFRDAAPVLDHHRVSDYFFDGSSRDSAPSADRDMTYFHTGHDDGL